MNTEITTRTYTVVYARGAVHIQGLDEQVRGGLDSLNYALSACSALSKNQTMWVRPLTTTDLAEAVKKATALAESGQVKGFCKKCRKTALAVLEAEAYEIEAQRAVQDAPAEVGGEWIEDVPEEDGRPVWTLSTDYDERAEIFFADVTGGGPCTWRVGECFPDGRILTTGEAGTVEEAQRQAEQAFARAVAQ
ncbi:hypothetical protein [Amycolatopsis vastitatis]|uniref:Uncharacterized protein n=1 Tax=Amycolatopsis vastitatis TaxID=1905142 RepID=A0A229TEH7_9PSEU|nr:hypothetical protein [Amycolatopsis vastitatis]OXM69647.1 hypothetical protein CF165_09060 [Amycolatopsis vastitatis]